MNGMNFELSEEQRMLRESALRYVQNENTLEKRREQIASEAGFSSLRWQHFAEMGWLGLTLPEDVGGFSCSPVEMVVLMEQFGRGMLLEPYVPTVVLGAQLIDRCGSEDVRQAMLPALIEGGVQLALAYEERGSRERPVIPQTEAMAAGDGGYLITGAKTMVLNAPDADHVIVTARMGDSDEVGLFLLPRSLAGVELTPYKLVCGRSAGDFSFDKVSCSEEQLLARGDVAELALEEVIDLAQLAQMAEALGGMESCMAITSEYVKSRVQFGQPIGKFQSVQHLMSDMFVETQEARSMVYQALSRIESEAPLRRKAISSARVVVGDAGRLVSAHGVQLHGGYGITDEYAVSHHYRQLFVLERLMGDVDYHLQRLVARSAAQGDERL